jgi:hypothetical protein
MHYLVVLLCGFYSIFFPTARANDGAVGIDGGQLAFKNLKGVEMLQEDLVLAPEQVSVKYIFRNKTAKDITSHVAFPISYMLETDTTFDTKSANPNGFYVEVNGKKVPFKSESKSKDGEFVRTHFWEQTFPAGKNTIIEHKYKPIYGSSVIDTIVKEGKSKDEAQSYYSSIEKDFCLSEKQRVQMAKDRHTFKILTYILTTANTWDGPIGTFNLTIKKGNKKFLFLCTKLDLKKNAQGDFQAYVKNYTPEANLNIAYTEK